MAGGPIRKFTSFLVVLALVTAGVSPACKFISGQTPLLTDRTTLAAHAHQQHHGGGDENKQDGGHGGHHAADPCAFCVAAHVNKAIGGTAPLVAAPSYEYRTDHILYAQRHLTPRFAGSAKARAPPLPA